MGQGQSGLQGLQGDKGDKGDKGERGDRGIQGLQGVPGLTKEELLFIIQSLNSGRAPPVPGLAPAPQAQAGPQRALENYELIANFDHGGDDIRNFPSNDANKCAEECERDVNCKAFNWSPVDPNRGCWLKNENALKGGNNTNEWNLYKKRGAPQTPGLAQVETLENGTYSIRGGKDNKFCADDNDNMRCNRDGLGGWEMFNITKKGNKYTIRGGRENKFCADDNDKMRCNRDGAGGWEEFDIKKDGDKYTIRGGRDNKICADEGGRIICDRNDVGQWEKFDIRKI